MYDLKRLSELFLLSILLIIATIFSDSRAGSPDMIRHWEKVLQKEGFSTDTPEGIIEATKSRLYIRRIALPVLSNKFPEKAIPVLKRALDDEYISVRITSAQLLGKLGDKSGLEQMQKDFNDLVPRKGATEPEDPNIAKDPKTMERWEKHRIYRISKGLEVALVLAELGDFEGYGLAAWQVKDGEIPAIRYRATDVLAEIAKTEQSILDKKNMFPADVMAIAVEQETNRTAYKAIVMAAEKLKGHRGRKILEAAVKNKNHEKDIRRVRGSLNKIKSELQNTENEIKSDVNNPNI